jgi:hypothetical protein
MLYFFGLLGALFVGAGALAYAIKARNLHYWLGTYVSAAERRKRARPVIPGTTVHVCIADHFEPYGGGASREQAQMRLKAWIERYPTAASRHRDSIGRPPCHTFFYPIEEYDPDVLDQLVALERRGLGSVEVHYHHDGDNASSLHTTLTQFIDVLRKRHGALRAEGSVGGTAYCFVHGNWALDNSRPDGRWCGVDNEIQVLVETGCRADFTLPSAPSDTQTRKINSIYFCSGRAGQRKSHDWGRDVNVGEWGAQGELLLIQGPLGLNWRSRKLGLFPRIENGEISADALPSIERARLWARLAPRIDGAEEHIFVKLHTHGAEDATLEALLGGGLETVWGCLEAEYRDRPGYQLRYVSAWEMYCSIREITLRSTGVA